MAFCCGIMCAWYLEHLFLRSCRSYIFKVCSVLISWGSWISCILDPNFLFLLGILEILSLDVFVLKWDPGDPGSYFSFYREILEILDPDYVTLPRDLVDLGYRHSILSLDPADPGS